MTEALYAAVVRADVESARPLVAGGADVNWPRRGRHRGLVLRTACRHPRGSAEMVALLLANGADPNGPSLPIVGAAQLGSLEILCLLLGHGADVNQRDTNGSALIWAIRESPTEVTLFLLEQGADPNLCAVPDPAHLKDAATTPLMTAAVCGSPEKVEALLRHGAQASTRNAAGNTALDLAHRMSLDPR